MPTRRFLVVRTRFHKIVIGLTLAFTIGLHWPILQSVAWVNMLITYAQEDGLEEAFIKTFDGKNPCKMCQFVAEGKQTEKKADRETLAKKLDLIFFASTAVFIPRQPIPESTPFISLPRLRSLQPPTPPPDLA